MIFRRRKGLQMSYSDRTRYSIENDILNRKAFGTAVYFSICPDKQL